VTDLRPVVAAQWRRVIDTVATVPDEAFTRPTRLPGWDVAALVAHLAGNPSYLPELLADDSATVGVHTAGTYYDSSPDDAAEIAAAAVAKASGTTPAQLRAWLEEQTTASTDLLHRLELDTPLAFESRTLLLRDYLPSRCTESVVHLLDLADATGVEPSLDSRALATVCRTLTTMLAARAPGRTVELRVPPYAAVQCVEGPRHTRGTPPNVVETDPVTWVRLATGRLHWRDATADGRIAASGERADLSPWLPVMS
jgi:uncharacterized protein (TIGR03083 family)